MFFFRKLIIRSLEHVQGSSRARVPEITHDLSKGIDNFAKKQAEHAFPCNKVDVIQRDDPIKIGILCRI